MKKNKKISTKESLFIKNVDKNTICNIVHDKIQSTIDIKNKEDLKVLIDSINDLYFYYSEILLKQLDQENSDESIINDEKLKQNIITNCALANYSIRETIGILEETKLDLYLSSRNNEEV